MKSPERRNLTILRKATDDSLKLEKNSSNALDLAEKNAFEYYDSRLHSYEADFQDLIAPHSSLLDFISDKYNKKLGDLVAIELGGPGVNLFSDLDPDGKVFRKTAGFTLFKLPEHFDLENNHEVVEADVLQRRGGNKLSFSMVEDWVKQNGKPDLIIERMVGPLHMIKSYKVFLQILDRWYKLLKDGGTMFIEIPKGMRDIDYDKLSMQINSAHILGVKIKMARLPGSTGYGIVLEKGEGAPISIK
jgi:hypothetical protein